MYNTIKKSGATIEGYNPIHDAESTFTLIKGLGNVHSFGFHGMDYTDPNFDNYSDKLVAETYNSFLVLECNRYKDLFYIFLRIDTDKNQFCKIGQIPSVADFHIRRLKTCTKLLPEDVLQLVL